MGDKPHQPLATHGRRGGKDERKCQGNDVGKAPEQRRHQQPDGPVAEVDGVGVSPEEGERPRLEEPYEPGAATHRTRDERHGAHGREEDAPAKRQRPLPEKACEQHEDRKRCAACDGRVPQHGLAEVARPGHDRGERHAQQEPHRMRVGALVDARGVGGTVQGRHGERAHGGEAGKRPHHPAAAKSARERAEEQRGHEVELHLHRDVPEVLEELGVHRVEVARPRGDGVPVEPERKGAQGLPPRVDEKVGLQHAREDGRRHDDEREGRRDAGEPPPPVG